MPGDIINFGYTYHDGATGATGPPGEPGAPGIGLTDGDKGDIIISGTGTVLTIDTAVVTNAKLADVATSTIKGRVAGGTGVPTDLSAAQVKTLLAIAEADVAGLVADLAAKAATSHSHPESDITSLVADLAAKASTAVFTAVANGLAPLSGGGTSNFLRADGTWQTPAGGGGATVTQALVNVGNTPVRTASVVVTDATVTTSSRIVLGWGGVVDTDENSPDMTEVDFAAVPGTGSFTARISSQRELIRGVFRLNYVKA